MIGVVDYGAGNLRNVQAALLRLGAAWKDVRQASDLAGTTGIVLPGVGRFGAAVRRLREAGLAGPLAERVRAGVPLLGICAGMQILFAESEEDPGVPGLALLPGAVRRLEAPRLPHIGWAVVERTDAAGPADASEAPPRLPRRFFAYFAHSYAVPATHPAVAAIARAPAPFAAIVRSGSIRATQFHPEKSGAAGAALLAEFVTPIDPEARRGGAAEEAAGAATVDEAPAGLGRARRIIPCLDIKGGRVVKGVRFRDLRDAGDPVERAAAYDRDGADEVCLLDISASVEERRPLLDLVRRVAGELSVPFTVGGGVRSVDEMRALLLAGADRVSIGTAAIEDPDLIARAADAFGSQFIIVSIDALRRGGGAEVTTHGGRRPTGRDAVAWAREAERLGAGEILLNCIDADGTRGGYDVDLTRRVARAVRLPVIASGGAGTAGDMARVLLEGEADAALAASIFHDGSLPIGAAKRGLRAAGVEVRP